MLLALVLVFGAAFVAVGLILLVHRVILPKMGVSIGSESLRADDIE